MYNISLLSPKTFVLLRDRYASDPFNYTKFLTIFSRFTDLSSLGESDSLLLFAKYNSDFSILASEASLTVFRVSAFMFPIVFVLEGIAQTLFFSHFLFFVLLVYQLLSCPFIR